VRATSVSSNFYEQQNQRQQSRGFQNSESTLVSNWSVSVASFIHSEFRISVLNQHGEVGRRRPSLDRGGESGCHKRQQLALVRDNRHNYSSHLDANMLKSTRLAVVRESIASRTLSTDENIVVASEHLAATEKVQTVVFGFILISGQWAVSLVASLFMPCFRRIFHVTAFWSIYIYNFTKLPSISWVVSCCCWTNRFGSALAVSRH